MRNEIRAFRRVLRPIAVLGFCSLLAGGVAAYDRYSQDNDATNCRACHGAFTADSYAELGPDGAVWPDSAMGVHLTMVSNGCDFCHSQGPPTPVLINSSDGVQGYLPVGCVGCHGRLEDATSGTVGAGAGLRQRHWRGGATVCIDCHADSDPANMTPVSEKISPPNFRPSPSYPNMPSNPCNPRPGFPEDKAGTTRGLDNDGDGIYDGNEVECATGSPTPGEAGMLVVTAHDRQNGILSIGYDITTCLAVENTIEFGRLSLVDSYTYDGQQCTIGNTGLYDWNYPAGPDSLFFVVVANDTQVEGSYGTSSAGDERPEDGFPGPCSYPQALADRCDP